MHIYAHELDLQALQKCAELLLFAFGLNFAVHFSFLPLNWFKVTSWVHYMLQIYVCMVLIMLFSYCPIKIFAQFKSFGYNLNIFSTHSSAIFFMYSHTCVYICIHSGSCVNALIILIGIACYLDFIWVVQLPCLSCLMCI